MGKRLCTAAFALIGLLLTSCDGSNPDNASMNTLLNLDARRLTFVFFYAPG